MSQYPQGWRAAARRAERHEHRRYRHPNTTRGRWAAGLLVACLFCLWAAASTLGVR